MLTEIFGDAPADKYKRASDQRGGAYSILIGIAANQCFKTGQPVRIDELVTGLTPPDRAPMPSPHGLVADADASEDALVGTSRVGPVSCAHDTVADIEGSRAASERAARGRRRAGLLAAIWIARRRP